MLCKKCFQKERSHTHEKNKKTAGVAAHLRRPCFSARPAAVAEDADCVAPRVRVGTCPYCLEDTLYFVKHYDAVNVNGEIMTYDLYQCGSCGGTVMTNISYG